MLASKSRKAAFYNLLKSWYNSCSKIVALVNSSQEAKVRPTLRQACNQESQGLLGPPFFSTTLKAIARDRERPFTETLAVASFLSLSRSPSDDHAAPSVRSKGGNRRSPERQTDGRKLWNWMDGPHAELLVGMSQGRIVHDGLLDGEVRQAWPQALRGQE